MSKETACDNPAHEEKGTHEEKFLGIAIAATMALPAVGGTISPAGAGEVPGPTQVEIAAMDYHLMLADGSEFPKKLKKGLYKFTFENRK